MNKKRYSRSDLVRSISFSEGISESSAKRIVNHMISCIVFALLDGNTVYLPRLCSLSLQFKQSKKGVHPQSLKPSVIPASIKLKTTTSMTFKDVLSEHVNDFEEEFLKDLTEEERKEYKNRAEDIIRRVKEESGEAE